MHIHKKKNYTLYMINVTQLKDKATPILLTLQVPPLYTWQSVSLRG